MYSMFESPALHQETARTTIVSLVLKSCHMLER
jgi:hypothetical protein